MSNMEQTFASEEKLISSSNGEVNAVQEQSSPNPVVNNVSNNEDVGKNDSAISTEVEEWMDILGSGQLKKKVIREGKPDTRPQRADICQVKFEGRLENGEIIEKEDCLTINIGDGEVIQGLDFAIPLMDVDEEAELVVGPRFAFGARGRQPDVPPGATLHYTVTLLSADPEPDIATYSIRDRKRIGNRKKERGNWWYSRQENTLAISCYRRALDFLDTDNCENIEGSNKPTDEEIHDIIEDRLKVYNNLAAAQMKIKAYDVALQSVENVLMCQPKNVKALFRKGKILAEKGDAEQSCSVLRLAYSLEPSPEIKKELERQMKLQKKHTAQERNLYKKMLGTNDVKTKPDKTERTNGLMWGALAGSVAAIVVGAVALRYKFM
ncbi:peptidyl-prolyl cis-trans isomerase FKBP8 [Nilaparvata lugens]|uniref:peptidyl-prolyl cis-trans isomerase FKBP8 n=1 Tax=Nilaparvata lugens TaxID=108931 RepID=UPI000B98F2D7|nr:peptidyl-prolyl cis-trans isomerase FKBP8 [Nilaparvata lugens]